jgi:hypothetical protein
VATTAYVVGQAGTASPVINGTAAVGTSLLYSRQDHVHASDTTRAPLASPTFTGTPLSTTATALTNTTQIATTAFVRTDNNVKAWVNFNGTGTVAIRASYNVTSITDSGVGTYTVNFTNTISDADYAVAGFARNAAGGAPFTLTQTTSYKTQTTSALGVVCSFMNSGTPTNADSEAVSVTIIR